MKFAVGIAFFTVIAIASTADQDFLFRTCKKSDPKFQSCLDNAIDHAIISFAKGNRGLKVVPLEPLLVDSISIGATGEASVSLKQEYKNIKLNGLTKGLKTTNSRVDFEKKKMYTQAFNPQVEFVANYKLDGKILLLPISGSGKSNITMFDLVTKSVIHFDMIQKNGETYLKIKKFNVEFNPGYVKMNFENLFNGDPQLGEHMNKFINENSDLLFKELKPEYESSFGFVFSKIAHDIFIRKPMNKFFPD